MVILHACFLFCVFSFEILDCLDCWILFRCPLWGFDVLVLCPVLGICLGLRICFGFVGDF